MNSGAGRESFHRVGDEVRGLSIDRSQIDRVSLAYGVIFAKTYMRLDACDVVSCAVQAICAHLGAWESDHSDGRPTPK